MLDILQSAGCISRQHISVGSLQVALGGSILVLGLWQPVSRQHISVASV